MASDDIPMFGIVIIFIAMGLFIFNFVMTNLNDNLLANEELSNITAFNESIQGTQKALDKFDWAVFAMFIGSILAILISAWLIAGNPLFMVVYVILGIVSILISFLLSNIWETFSTATAFATTLAKFPITNFILLNLPTELIVIFFLSIVILFGKPYMQGGQ